MKIRKSIFLVITIVFLTIMLCIENAASAAKVYVGEIKTGLGVISGITQDMSIYVSHTPQILPTFFISMDKYRGQFGLNFTAGSRGGSSNSHFDLYTSHEYLLSKNKISSHVGIIILYTTDNKVLYNLANEAARNQVRINPYFGYTIDVINNFNISMDFIPVGYTSVSWGAISANNFSLVGRAMLSAHYYF